MTTGKFTISKLSDSSLSVEVSGDWHLHREVPSPEQVIHEITAAEQPARLSFAASGLGDWDSGLLIFLKSIADTCQSLRIDLDLGQLPGGLGRLVQLSEAVPERKGARSVEQPLSFLRLCEKERAIAWACMI